MSITIYPKEQYEAIEEIRREIKKPWYKKPEAWFSLIAALAAFGALLFAWGQFEMAWTQIDEQHDGNALQGAIWEYEKMRNDRLERRDVEWRRRDLENKEVVEPDGG